MTGYQETQYSTELNCILQKESPLSLSVLMAIFQVNLG